MKGSTARAWLGALLVAMASSTSDAGEPLQTRVSVSSERPPDVIIQAFVEPDDGNRSLEFVVESPAFYASSTWQLDGAQAPRTHEVRFREVPGGKYEVSVTLAGSRGKRSRVVKNLELW